MRNWILVCLLFAVSLSMPLSLFAASDLNEIEREIEELKTKITEKQAQERTLDNEIKSMDNQIHLFTLQVAETETKIRLLGDEIYDLNEKINQQEETLTKLSRLLLNRIVTSYKVKRTSYLPLLFASNGISDFINRAKYIQMAQVHDRQVLEEVQNAKVNFSEKKELREEKKREQEELKVELVKQKEKLASQKKAKQALLEQTKNDEATYQKLLQQALAEKRAIEAALVSGTQVGPVKAGDPIALVGNTGYPACSTGPHLHFEVRKDNQWVNSFEFLSNRSVIDQQNGGGNSNLGSGSWDWPLTGDIVVTQHYGLTPYSWRYAYSGGIHTGIDMYSYSSQVIRAPKDGTLYAASQNCGGSSIIKIKYIDHGDGLISLYLHVQ